MQKISAKLEDYLKAVYILNARNKEVCITDVAEFLDVSKPSVSRAMGNLRDLGLIIHEYYGGIVLTDRGKTHAIGILRRHLIMRRFFEDIIGVDADTAERDSCRVEHALSEETMQQLDNYFEDMPSAEEMKVRSKAFRDLVFGKEQEQ